MLSKDSQKHCSQQCRHSSGLPRKPGGKHLGMAAAIWHREASSAVSWGQSSLSLGVLVCIMGRMVRRRLCKMAGSLCHAGVVCTLCSWRGITCMATISQHCCSVAHSCPTLCNPTDCSTPGFPVLHHPPAFAQTQRPLSQ